MRALSQTKAPPGGPLISLCTKQWSILSSERHARAIAGSELQLPVWELPILLRLLATSTSFALCTLGGLVISMVRSSFRFRADHADSDLFAVGRFAFPRIRSIDP